MFKQIFTLFRGTAYEVTEATVDRHAITILRQQIRDCADAISAAQKAVAFAIAQNEQEVQQQTKLVARIDDLENRVIAALEQDKQGLAREAAETIAHLQAERDASEDAQKTFTIEIERLKRVVRNSTIRLRELQRGERIAVATDKTQALRHATPSSGSSALEDAEATLAKLRNRQKQIDATAAAMDEMDQIHDPLAITQKLAEAGCGAPVRTTADQVLARLSAKLNKSA